MSEQGGTFQTYIDLGDDVRDEPSSTAPEDPQTTAIQPDAVDNTNRAADGAAKEKLCGFLRKYRYEVRGQMGRMMSTRYRRCWFVLADSTCMLLYYASPDEQTPLGQIDIATASFSFDLSHRHRPWSFVISSRGQKYSLEASDQSSLRFWLQQLQKRRSEYSQWKMRMSSGNLHRALQEADGGLMGESRARNTVDSGVVSLRGTSTAAEGDDDKLVAAPGEQDGKPPVAPPGGQNGTSHVAPSGGQDGKSSTAPSDGQDGMSPAMGNDLMLTNNMDESADKHIGREIRDHDQPMPVYEIIGETVGDEIRRPSSVLSRSRIPDNEVDEGSSAKTAADTDGVKTDDDGGLADGEETAIEVAVDTTGLRESAEAGGDDVAAGSGEGRDRSGRLAPVRRVTDGSGVTPRSPFVNMRLQHLPFAKYYRAQLGNVVAEHNHQLDVNAAVKGGREDERDVSVDATGGQLPSSMAVDRGQHLSQSRLSPLKRFLRPKSFSGHVGTSGCRKCRELDGLLSCEQQTLRARSEELAATREVMKILQKHIDTLERQRLTQFKFCLSASEERYLAMLREKDSHTVQLEHLLALRDEEMQLLTAQMRCLEEETSSLEQRVSMYEESIRAKDEIVVSLTHNLAQQQAAQPPPPLPLPARPQSWLLVAADGPTDDRDDNAPPAPAGTDGVDVERLQDACTAFEEQNAFLNSEILELNKLREDDEVREKDLCMKFAELEACYCQMESKYLLCLRELQTPRRGGDDSNEEMVTRLLQDAMDTDGSEKKSGLIPSRVQHSSRGHSVAVFDKYGFTRLPVYELDDGLEERARNLQRLSDKLSSRQQNVNLEISNEVKWESFVLSLGDRPVTRSQELKNLIRCGVPVQHRQLIWNACINLRIGKWREQFGKTYYEDLLQKCKDTAMLNPALKQIELDLLRTLPTNRHYQVLSCEGVLRLRRVLSAYSMHNPVIGYCQGINRLAALALLFLNEEDAFWCLIVIVENIMPPEYYSATLAAAHADQGVLKELLQEKLPRLHAHFVHQRVDVSLFSFNWFLTVFVDNVPTDVYLRIWDAFLYEGSKVLFRFAVAFFKYNEETMMAEDDSMALYSYLRTMPDDIVNVNKLAQIAFEELNPFPMRFISAKRQTHLLHVKSQLMRLDSQRRMSIREPRTQSERQDFLSDDDV